MQQAEAGAGEYQLPIVVLHELGGRAVDDLVILRRSEFGAWFGGWRGRDDAQQALDAFLQDCEARGLSVKTLSYYQQQVGKL